MKIIYCISGTYNSGGMERVLMNKANYFADCLHHNVIIITTEQKGRANFFNFSSKIKFIDLGINYEDDLKCNIFSRLISKFKKKKEHRKRLTSVLLQEKADICISMFDFDADFLYKIKDGSTKILEFHFSRYLKVIEAKSFLMKLIQRIRTYDWKRFAAKYAAFVVLTEEDKQTWGKMANIHVIPNPIVNLPSEMSDLTNKQVVSLGRLSYQKGFDHLIKAWAKVHQIVPDWRLNIFGNGPLEKELKDLCEKYALDGSLVIHSAISNPSQVYLNSSLYVMSSRYEGLPMVLLEAISYGLPIVSYACPCGPRDIITPQIGTLVENGNVDDLAREIVCWIQNDRRRKEAGMKAKEVAQNFKIENIMYQWLTLFNQIRQ